MEDNIYLDIGFMIFGLAFFIYTLNWVNRSHREDHSARLMEAREFGFKGSKLERESRRIFFR